MNAQAYTDRKREEAMDKVAEWIIVVGMSALLNDINNDRIVTAQLDTQDYVTWGLLTNESEMLQFATMVWDKYVMPGVHNSVRVGYWEHEYEGVKIRIVSKNYSILLEWDSPETGTTHISRYKNAVDWEGLELEKLGIEQKYRDYATFMGVPEDVSERELDYAISRA